MKLSETRQAMEFKMPTMYLSTKSPGNISSAFSHNSEPVILSQRYLDLKKDILKNNEKVIEDSWKRLVSSFEFELQTIKKTGPNIIPQVEYHDIIANGGQFPENVANEIRKRGVVVVKNVVDKNTALGYKKNVKEYIKTHPGEIVGFPENNPQVWEIYWSKSQIEARSNPNFNTTATAVNQLWHADVGTEIDLATNLSYCDRLRIREPNDRSFVLSEHVDGGSVERWEDPEYRKCYSNILEGNWEAHDPFDATHRVNAKMDLYNCSGGCSMFRSFQGWLSLSHVKPGGGTLKVCPLIKLSSAYIILRPLLPDLVETTNMAGASPGVQQNILPDLHPHIVDAMVSVPEVNPGDCVFWHSDCVHAVEAFCGSVSDSSVLYIPATPLCRKNAEYLLRQREAFVHGTSPPDFPLNNCEINFKDRAFPSDLTELGKLTMGFSKFNDADSSITSTSKSKASLQANKVLFG